jgi:hypothetical protein
MSSKSRAEAEILDAEDALDEAERPPKAKKSGRKSGGARKKQLQPTDDALSMTADAPMAFQEPSRPVDLAVEDERQPQGEAERAPAEAVSAPAADVPAEAAPAWVADAPAVASALEPAVVERANAGRPAGHGNGGEPSMNEDLKQNVQARDTWVRLAYMVLFGVVFYFGQFVIALAAVVQFLHKLLNGAPNLRLAAFGSEVAVYYREMIDFLSYHSERVLFPFSPWPRTGASESHGAGAHEAAQ